MAKKKEKEEAPVDGFLAALNKGMKNAGCNTTATTVVDYWNNIRYIPFVDPFSGRPSLANEWLIGAKGFPEGKIYQLRASFSSGKSSYLYWLYGCALYGSTPEDRTAWVEHIETEGAPNSPDFIARFGVDPNKMAHVKSHSLQELFNVVDTFDLVLHGSKSGGTINPDTGRMVKSKFSVEDALDPEHKKFAIVGIDSLSNVDGGKTGDFVDLSKSEKPGGDSKDVRSFMRKREQHYDDEKLTLFVTTHETTEIKTGPGAGYGGPKSTARNQKALGMALTIAIDTKDYMWTSADKKPLGSRQILKTFKSKIAPRYRTITMYRKDLGGYDLALTDLMFFMGDPKNNNCLENPFLPGGFLCPKGAKCGITKERGGWRAPMISDKLFKTPAEFCDALYGDKERLSKIRETLRIRGFGFDFETKFTLEELGVDPEDIGDDESADGDESEETEGVVSQEET